MTGTLILNTPEHPEIELHTISEGDLENLRIWKNTYRDAFFFKDIITPEGQRSWYKGYLNRDHDFMFTIRHVGQAIGCIGFRHISGNIDIYNVIMGNSELSGKGYMSIALHIMIEEAVRRYPDSPVTLVVLKDNPALNWYQKNGFSIASEAETSYDLVFEPTSLHTSA